MDALIFALAVFIGWMIFDYVKQKRFTKENLLGALIASIIAGIAWFVLNLFSP